VSSELSRAKESVVAYNSNKWCPPVHLHHILWLHVKVHAAMVVQVLQRTQQLVEHINLHNKGVRQRAAARQHRDSRRQTLTAELL
jgi:hypothetical protein